MKNVLIEEIGWWLHRDALEVKAERTVELIQTLQCQGNDDALDYESSSEEESDDDTE